MRVSVVIPVFNGANTLAECLTACLAQTYGEFDVIVVDDGSTDETARVAKTFDVHYLHQENAGPAAARNRGAWAAQGGIVVFTDSDCIPEANWIDSLVAGFDEETVAVGGGYEIANKSSLLARMIHEEISLRHDRYGDEVDFLGSFNVAYRRDVFEEVGGFDESFPVASAEDNDLAYRLLDMEGKLRFAREAQVAHYHPTKLMRYLKTQMMHGYWRMKLYAKHPKRAQTGDRYAGLTDFAAPPLSLLLFVGLALLVISIAIPGLASWGLGIALPVGLVYALTQAGLPLRMMRRSGDPTMLLFFPVLFLRDLARAAGMLRGIWTFILMKRGTA